MVSSTHTLKNQINIPLFVCQLPINHHWTIIQSPCVTIKEYGGFPNCTHEYVHFVLKPIVVGPLSQQKNLGPSLPAGRGRLQLLGPAKPALTILEGLSWGNVPENIPFYGTMIQYLYFRAQRFWLNWLQTTSWYNLLFKMVRISQPRSCQCFLGFEDLWDFKIWERYTQVASFSDYKPHLINRSIDITKGYWPVATGMVV